MKEFTVVANYCRVVHDDLAQEMSNIITNVCENITADIIFLESVSRLRVHEKEFDANAMESICEFAKNGQDVCNSFYESIKLCVDFYKSAITPMSDTLNELVDKWTKNYSNVELTGEELKSVIKSIWKDKRTMQKECQRISKKKDEFFASNMFFECVNSYGETLEANLGQMNRDIKFFPAIFNSGFTNAVL